MLGCCFFCRLVLTRSTAQGVGGFILCLCLSLFSFPFSLSLLLFLCFSDSFLWYTGSVLGCCLFCRFGPTRSTAQGGRRIFHWLLRENTQIRPLSSSPQWVGRDGNSPATRANGRWWCIAIFHCFLDGTATVRPPTSTPKPTRHGGYYFFCFFVFSEGLKKHTFFKKTFFNFCHVFFFTFSLMPTKNSKNLGKSKKS